MLVGEAEGFITEIAVLFHPATAHVSTTKVCFFSLLKVFFPIFDLCLFFLSIISADHSITVITYKTIAMPT